MEVKIDGFELPKLGASYGNLKRVLGGEKTKVEEHSKRQHLRQMVRQCQETKYVAIRIVEVLVEDGSKKRKEEVLASRTLFCGRRSVASWRYEYDLHSSKRQYRTK